MGSTVKYRRTLVDSEEERQIPMKAMDDQLFEYACHEGNYSVSNVLSDARYQERIEADGSRD